MGHLIVRGAREHNLQGVDLELEHGTWVAVTGLSGSGKTTLVFDTLVREGQRRWLSALSVKARQALGKLGRADVDTVSGLPPVVAVGQHTGSASPRSTVGTLTGVLDLLRLWFAREAIDPGGVELTRSHFSFNHPVGQCAACKGLGVEDLVDPELLVADPAKSLRDGALVPTLKSGYTVYSQVTLEVMDQICRAHDFDVHTPWSDLTDAQQHVILHGSTALKVPFGKHSIESRMRWEGITARPREEGFYRGLIPVITETLTRNRNPNVLRFVRTVPCSVCAGSRLARSGREAALSGTTLPALLALPVSELLGALTALPDSPVAAALRPSVLPRLDRMATLDLGHLSLQRRSTTLSGGEAQRLRLAAQATAGLSGLLVALDEPTLGLHPSGQQGMAAVLDELRGLGNTLVLVEHDPDMVLRADRVVQLGPGAGPAGGRVVADGPPTPGALPVPPPPTAASRAARGELVLRGATLHNLKGVELRVALGALTVVSGPSGAGKSSLVFGTLLPALTQARGGPFTSVEGWPADHRVRWVDATPIGRTPRSTPATWTSMFDHVRKRFAATPQAKAAGWSASRFSYNHKSGRCATCEGLGVQRIGLHLLEDVELPCPVCGGDRYAADTLQVRWRGRTIAEVLQLSAAQAVEALSDDPAIGPLCRAMVALGLGYLQLGQSSTTLSRGEAQRIKLATLVGTPSAQPLLVLLDEPDRGLHPDDVQRLLVCVEALLGAGHTVVAISHHRQLWAAADHLVELRDGELCHPQVSERVAAPPRAPRAPCEPPAEIRMTGVRTHTLAGLDVSIPHRKLVVVAGVSGSGKSSLVHGTLAAEAWRRFSESLPFGVRRYLRRLPRAVLDDAVGLTPTLVLKQGGTRAGPRSTVATQTGLGPVLRLLWSRAGVTDSGPTRLTAGHFSPDRTLGACAGCEGRGTVQRCSPEVLVSHPDRSLLDGALGGTKPGRFFGEVDGQYLATLKAAVGEAVDLGVPWAQLAPDVQRVALDGAGDQVWSVTWRYQRGARSGEHHFEGPWPGLCALVEAEARVRARRADADAWAEPLVAVPCSDCRGARLGPEARAVTVGARTLPELLACPAEQALTALEALEGSGSAAVVLGALRPELTERLRDLVAMGLGHLSLDRATDTLSGGELQRVRLVGVCRAGLSGTTVVLDEPGAGLHVSELGRLVERLHQLRDAGNTVVVVSHRPTLLRAADHLIELGPGAGPLGGHVVAAGPAADVLQGDTVTSVALRRSAPTRQAAPRASAVRVIGARARTLQHLDLTLPGAGVVVLTGVSGSGKSTLLFEVIEASARAGVAVGCTALEGLERFAEVRSARARGPIGSPLDALGLLPAVQALFHREAGGSGLPKRAFSYRSPAGRCEVCRGSGVERVAMDILADLQLPCPACAGRRFRPEVLAVQWSGLHIATFLERPASALLALEVPHRLRQGIESLVQVGLGHLALGRRGPTLSGGEAQRLLLAATLLQAPAPSLVLLDEPATGLHEQDLQGLVGVFDALVQAGSLVVAAEHRATVIAAADTEIALGPGPGDAGGQLVYLGRPRSPAGAR